MTMRFEGRLRKKGRFWLVEVPILDVMTQGRSRREALVMIKDAIESLADRPGLSVTVHATRGNDLEIEGDDTAVIVALLLRRQREKHGLSLADVAKRLGQSSRNAYARYEQGTSVPTVDTLNRLLHAVAPKSPLVLRVGRAA
jgi:ribosome-binding protein aMBF1 (putative translation factor)